MAWNPVTRLVLVLVLSTAVLVLVIARGVAMAEEIICAPPVAHVVFPPRRDGSPDSLRSHLACGNPTFCIEDDPQAGWDHVSGYRTIAFCVSPYATRGVVVSTQYNTTSMLRTIEQILGLPPMNQFDASATPMFDCFTEQPDFTPFRSVAANIPLDQMNPEPHAIDDTVLREDAIVSASLNFREIDRAPEDVLNRTLWRSVRGSQRPYPEEHTDAGTDAGDARR